VDNLIAITVAVNPEIGATGQPIAEVSIIHVPGDINPVVHRTECRTLGDFALYEGSIIVVVLQ
jgi:hypothetical protein